MKPQQKTVVREIVVWDCGDSAHCHKNEATALTCMREAARKLASQHPWFSDPKIRRKLAARLRARGFTFQRIGALMGVSGNRASGLVSLDARDNEELQRELREVSDRHGEEVRILSRSLMVRELLVALADGDR